MGQGNIFSWFRGRTNDVISSGGVQIVPAGGWGTKFYVNPDHDNATDTNNPGTDFNKPLSTIAAAYALMTTNKDDVCILSGNSAHAVTEMLTIAKNRVHFVGQGPLRMYGCASRITMGVTTAATDLGVMQNTGVRNSFTNIKFDSANTVAESLYSVVEAGEYAVYDHCEIYKSTDMDVTGAAELVSNGDSSQFHNCTIGSLVNASTGAIIRPNILVTKAIVTGKVSRDVQFINCNIWRKSGNTANRFVYGANATDVERMMLFENCKFWNAKLAAAVPAQNVAFAASLTQGEVLLNNCVAINAATAMSTTTGVFVNGPNETSTAGGAEIGIALQAS
jgi:hypothetical protein